MTMGFPYYSGSGSRSAQPAPLALPRSRHQFLQPETYIADEGLKDACNVALMLGQPLLLTGEPGTGKTQFAESLAWELHLECHRFEAKSTSEARDLFYTYDALKRLHDIQSKNESTAALHYLSYQALGKAILTTLDPLACDHLLLPEERHPAKARSVVLIDEMDKAPRDFPNDLLNELEHLFFRIPELGNQRVVADPDLQPIVVITSNSEKNLPDAFLRRCVYYHIPFPDRRRLEAILARHPVVDQLASDSLLQQALDFFEQLREPQQGLSKKPATAELLSWLLSLHSLRQQSSGVASPGNLELFSRSLSSLIKTSQDQAKARALLEQWLKAP
jgi:MoxR-like ATPase